MSINKQIIIASIFANSFFSFTVSAAGLWLYEGATPEMGTASAGRNAIADSASTASFNPAGMTRLEQNELMVGIQPMYVKARFNIYVGKLMKELQALGIEDNTLVIMMADNGPMIHNGPPGMLETLYRRGKGDFLEGGVRVTAHARWPGVIEEGQIIGDIIHETDLFTTFARIAGAEKYLPTDRIIDGVDQTALLLEGDGESRRDYVFIYTGNQLSATVKGRYKRDWRNAIPGLSGAEFYDLYNDPREVHPFMLQLFPAKTMFSLMKTRHLMMKEAYPDNGQARDFPFKNVVNARPETIYVSKPRIDAKKLPFDPREAIMKVPEWDNLDRGWGTSLVNMARSL